MVARGRISTVLLVSPGAGAVAFGALLASYGWIFAPRVVSSLLGRAQSFVHVSGNVDSHIIYE